MPGSLVFCPVQSALHSNYHAIAPAMIARCALIAGNACCDSPGPGGVTVLHHEQLVRILSQSPFFRTNMVRAMHGGRAWGWLEKGLHERPLTHASRLMSRFSFLFSVCSRHFDCDVAMAMICGQAKILIRRMKEPCLAVH
jgi:hypothetical protein